MGRNEAHSKFHLYNIKSGHYISMRWFFPWLGGVTLSVVFMYYIFYLVRLASDLRAFRTASRWRSSAHLPSMRVRSRSAPLLMSARSAPASPRAAASIAAVVPSFCAAFGSSPAEMRRRTQSVWPSRAAIMSAFAPARFVWSGFQSASHSARTSRHSTKPPRAALVTTLHPFPSIRSRSTPSLMRRRSTSACPDAAASTAAVLPRPCDSSRSH
mmetsp:Transcript_397/g.1308  ORF Transcript_397/g.1308 Transcript_397/m.1308 type:complete len:213 (+) Transcript_397:1665-2303(+)